MPVLKSSAITAGILSLALLLSGCSDSSKLASTREESTPVIKINEYEVPMELYRYVAMNYRTQYEAGLTEEEAAGLWLGDEGKQRLAELEENTFSTLRNLYATLSLAAEYNLTPDSALINESVSTRMDEIYESYENDTDAYLESLEPYYMNDTVYRFLTQDEVLTEELFYAMLNRGEILSDEEALRDMIESDRFIRIKQILIAADNGNSAETNRAKAEEIHDRLEAGEDFETLLKTCGEDLYMFNNADGYYIIRGNRYEAFEDAAFALEAGEYSDVVETEAGYSILMRYEKETDYINSHFDELCQEYFDSAYNAILQEHLATLTVVKLPALENYTIFTME
ncbi:MAG: peptidylprolyl isomerase [Clostridia bacterium]|nr:peptidylprolyl isomerase [Clostridia bacterium]